MVFGSWVSYITKNWIKRKLSAISEFSILGAGQNRKLGNLGNFHFFLLNLIVQLQFFEVIFLVFVFWVSYTTKNWSKRKLPEIFKFSISGIDQNRKLENLGNFIFFGHCNLKVLFPIVFWSWVSASKVYNKKGEKKTQKHRNLRNFNPCTLMGYSCKMETNLIVLILHCYGSKTKTNWRWSSLLNFLVNIMS